MIEAYSLEYFKNMFWNILLILLMIHKVLDTVLCF